LPLLLEKDKRDTCSDAEFRTARTNEIIHPDSAAAAIDSETLHPRHVTLTRSVPRAASDKNDKRQGKGINRTAGTAPRSGLRWLRARGAAFPRGAGCARAALKREHRDWSGGGEERERERE